MRAWFLLVVGLLGCSGDHTDTPATDARADVPEFPETSISLDVTLDKLTVEQANQLCQDIRAWAMQVTAAESSKGVNDHGLCRDNGRAWGWISGGASFDTKACDEHLASCLAAAKDADEVAFDCSWIDYRSGCAKLPTARALVTCQRDRKRALLPLFASVAELTCSDLAAMPKPDARRPASCEAVLSVCSSLL